MALGRISPEKRLEDVVEILRRVRARGEAVRLHLVGTQHDADYTARIRRLVAAEAYTLTAWTAIEIVRRAASGGVVAGYQTPSTAFGADFILTFTGSTREDL